MERARSMLAIGAWINRLLIIVGLGLIIGGFGFEVYYFATGDMQNITEDENLIYVLLICSYCIYGGIVLFIDQFVCALLRRSKVKKIKKGRLSVLSFSKSMIFLGILSLNIFYIASGVFFRKDDGDSFYGYN